MYLGILEALGSRQTNGYQTSIDGDETTANERWQSANERDYQRSYFEAFSFDEAARLVRRDNRLSPRLTYLRYMTEVLRVEGNQTGTQTQDIVNKVDQSSPVTFGKLMTAKAEAIQDAMITLASSQNVHLTKETAKTLITTYIFGHSIFPGAGGGSKNFWNKSISHLANEIYGAQHSLLRTARAIRIEENCRWLSGTVGSAIGGLCARIFYGWIIKVPVTTERKANFKRVFAAVAHVFMGALAAIGKTINRFLPEPRRGVGRRLRPRNTQPTPTGRNRLAPEHVRHPEAPSKAPVPPRRNHPPAPAPAPAPAPQVTTGEVGPSSIAIRRRKSADGPYFPPSTDPRSR